MPFPDLFRANADTPESPYAWLRLVAAVAIGTIGNVGMWSGPVVLPAVQADFGVDRAAASFPYTMNMVGFAIAAVVLGRAVDRVGILLPLVGGTVVMCVGYVLTAVAPNILTFALLHALIGCGTAVFFAPLMADISHWFLKRRGIAVAICASGNYLAGTLWPTALEYFIRTAGWRATHVGAAVFCFIAILPITLLLRRRAPHHAMTTTSATSGGKLSELGVSSRTLMVVLFVAGLACCVAMAMPQVHIVAYCGDLGYGVTRGAEMLSIMLGFGIVSRIASGFIADKIGGVGTLLLGSILQGLALVGYLLFDGLASLYVISAMFGLFQGGIVPSYTIIIREYFPPQEAATRVGIVIMATLVGMAFGAWLSGVIFDYTGSYRAAFAHGIAWNVLNVAIAAWLLMRSGKARPALAAA